MLNRPLRKRCLAVGSWLTSKTCSSEAATGMRQLGHDTCVLTGGIQGYLSEIQAECALAERGPRVTGHAMRAPFHLRTIIPYFNGAARKKTWPPDPAPR